MRSRIWVVVLVLVVAACAEGTSDTTTTGGATTSPPQETTTTVVTTTTSVEPTTTTTAAPGLDLTDEPWVIHTIEGVYGSSGELLFESSPVLGEENIVRDREGGIIFTDSFGLWWWRAGEVEPEFVLDGYYFRLVEAIPTAEGPVIRIADFGDRYISLGRLTEVAPIPGTVEIMEDFAVIRHAANGLSATVTQPEVTLTTEGFPDEVIEPAHLVIARDGDTLLDVRIGGPVEAYARIHDFDGQHVIVSRGPYEPALPPETYMVIDLACPECTSVFVESAATAALTGPDVDWNGIVAGPSDICSAWDPTYTEAPSSAGLPTMAAAARNNLLRGAAACDLTSLQYQIDIDAQVVLSHADFNVSDTASWFEAGLDALGDIPQTLSQPWREVEVDGAPAYVFPSWFAVDGWDELTGSEQAAMIAWYGENAADFWTDYLSIARDDDLAVTIAATGEVVRLERPLS